MSHLIVYDGHITVMEESDKSPVGRLALAKGKPPPREIPLEEMGSFSQVNKILANPCSRLVPCNFGPLIDNWEELAAVRKLKLAPTHQSSETRKSILQKPRLIELATYPGYTENESTPLPFSLSVADIINDVIDAQTYLQKKPRFREYCRSNFMDVKIHKIILDLFWWVFLDTYSKNKFVQENLFIRIANTFGNFFALLEKNKFRDRFLQVQLDILCQTIFSAFIRGYPTSSKQFDGNFKTKICNLIHFWFSGLPPFPNSWKSWPIDKLVLKGIVLPNSDDVNTSATENNSFTLSRREEEPREDKTKQNKFILTNKPESIPIHGPTFTLERTLLRTTGHSPLMEYYLSSKDMLHPVSHSMLLSHSHPHIPPNTTGITYYDFLKRYNNRAQARRDKMYEIMRSTDDKILKRRLEENKNHKLPTIHNKQSIETRDGEKHVKEKPVVHIMSNQTSILTNTPLELQLDSMREP